MTEPLFNNDLVRGSEIPQNWKTDLGGDILSKEAYRFILKPIVNPLPIGQEWTTSNVSHARELGEISKKYKAEGRENKTMLTLQAFSVSHYGLSDEFGDFLSSIGQDRAASHVWDGDSEEVTLALGTCSYYEHLAWVRKDVLGLESPNGLLVSLLVSTSDNKLIFARRKSVATGVGEIGVIGGTFDYGPNRDTPTPLEIAEEEIHEELGVEKDESESRLITLMEDKLGRPVLFYNSVLRLASDEVSRKWRNSETAQREHSELIFIDNNLKALKKFAKEHKPGEFHPPADLIFQRSLQDLLWKRERENIENFESIASGTTPI